MMEGWRLQQVLEQRRKAAESEYIDQIIQEAFQKGVERGRFEERMRKNKQGVPKTAVCATCGGSRKIQRPSVFPGVMMPCPDCGGGKR